MKKILVVFGTRPEAIKMSPVIHSLKNNNLFLVKVCVTAQHREMLDQVLKIFKIEPDYDLDIMQPGQDLFDVTVHVLNGIKEVLNIEKPDLVLVHGDTTTSTISALACNYLKIPVGHVEAGLRTYNRDSPWPEEINRQLTARLSDVNFAPTKQSKSNLLNEQIAEESIHVTGNTVIDSLLFIVSEIQNNETKKQELLKQLISIGLPNHLIKKWQANKKKLVLITGHRRENFGHKFLSICSAIKELADRYPSVDFVYPMHLNPNVRKAIKKSFELDSDSSKNFHIYRRNLYFIEPLDYLPFIYLMSCSYIILTDSGGIQEEAPSLGKPVLVMRDTTERQEGIEAGTIKLVGTDTQKIVSTVSSLIHSEKEYLEMSEKQNPFGDGNSSKRISEILTELFSK